MISVSYTVTQHGQWQIATVRGLMDFIAWGKRGRIQGPDALREPGEVYFEFGKTANEARERLLASLS